MKKLYDKSEIWFAVAWIVIYVVVMGNMRASFGDASPWSALCMIAIAALLSLFIFRNGLAGKYGLTRPREAKKFLYYIPLAMICSVNLWAGVAARFDPSIVFAVLTMALVGYVEEVIFRGLLFRAMEKENLARAIVVSAVTFGAGHIVNLFTGAALGDTLWQLAYAVAIGFAFVMVFHAGGSLVPCIVAHSAIDVLSKFANTDAPENVQAFLGWFTPVFLIVVAGGYALYIHLRCEPE